jgi:LPXTG-site transpeptidase (sortase) family protein
LLKEKIRSKSIILGIALAFTAFFFLVLNLAETGSSAKLPPPSGGGVSQPAAWQAGDEKLSAEAPGQALPVRLKIPKINVDAAIEYVGVTSAGAMDVPKGPSDAAWFELGPRPGEAGSAVIAGHEGWKNGIPAVFDDLYKLAKGDKIYVEDEKGETLAFAVRSSRPYGENDDASGVFVSSDGISHLNLITCEGIWNGQKKSYSDRLVVFADKVIR